MLTSFMKLIAQCIPSRDNYSVLDFLLWTKTILSTSAYPLASFLGIREVAPPFAVLTKAWIFWFTIFHYHKDSVQFATEFAWQINYFYTNS